MFYDYFGITDGVVIERAIELEGEINQNKDQEQLLQSYFMTKTKSASWKNTHHLKDTNVYIYEFFSKETMAIRKLSWDKVKKLR